MFSQPLILILSLTLTVSTSSLLPAKLPPPATMAKTLLAVTGTIGGDYTVEQATQTCGDAQLLSKVEKEGIPKTPV